MGLSAHLLGHFVPFAYCFCWGNLFPAQNEYLVKGKLIGALNTCKNSLLHFLKGTVL